MALNLPTAYNLLEFDLVDSTNSTATEIASKGEEVAPDGTLIWAREQKLGRGRRGKVWDSPRGNLYLSLILRPEIPLSNATQLSFVAALALYDTLGNIGPAGHQVHCKWPNDILLNNKKVAGILIETEGRFAKDFPNWLILGLGLNIEWHPKNKELNATSLKFEGWETTVEDALQGFSRSFLSWTNKWLDDGFRPIRENWLWRSIGKGSLIKVNIGDRILEGIFQDIDKDGALLLNQNGVVKRITTGDVFFLEP